jgi:tetratricopeptide (TPR) repeat protein
VDSPEISFEKGETYKEMGLFNEAIAEFKKAMANDSLRSRASREIASCFLSMGMEEKAEKTLLKALLHPHLTAKDRMWISSDLASLYEKQSRIESALERLMQIQGEDPEFFPDLNDRILRLHELMDSVTFPAFEDPLEATAEEKAPDSGKEAPTLKDAAAGQRVFDDPRRGARRVRYSHPVEYSFDQIGWATGYSGDISATGMFVLTHEPVPVGSVVFLRFAIPQAESDTKVEVIGQAVRQQNKEQEGEGVLGMGVHFLSMDQSLRVTLGSIVDRLHTAEAEVAAAQERVRFHCDECGRVLTALSSLSGKLAKCRCGHSMPIPFEKFTPSDDVPLRGMILAGCRLDGIIGKGSVAVVYKGYHRALDIPVAVKILNPSLKKTGSQLALKFLQEARVIARIKHPNIVAVMNAGEEGGHSFIVMQFVKGASLATVLQKGTKLELNSCIRMFVGVCSALQAAHDHSVVHGDIKPANILLTPGGTAMLVDFGLVKDLKTYKEDTAKSGMALGTPLYMSPEQAKGEHAVDFRSDIYSLGATMYHVFAGRPPFGGFTNLEVIRKHIKDPLQPLNSVAHEVPASISEIVGKTLEKKPENRFQSAEELKQALLKVSTTMAAEQFRPLIKKSRHRQRPSS